MIYDALVIGKGPAGITASIYIKRAGYNPIVIGKDGGALEKTEKIENYYGFKEPVSGKQLFLEGMKQAQNLGIEIVTDEVLSVEYDGKVYIVKTRGREYSAKTVIIATGTNRKKSKIKGIKEYEGKGVSYCAVCDAFFYRGKDVAVLGNGQYALHEAKYLQNIVNTVTILTNGKNIEFDLASEVKLKDNLKIDQNEIDEIIGDEKIETIKLKNNTKIQIDGLFIANGTASSVDLAKKIGAKTNNNRIIVNENMQTSIKGLYAAGDCTGGLLQISKAVYEGAKAATEIINFLK